MSGKIFFSALTFSFLIFSCASERTVKATDPETDLPVRYSQQDTSINQWLSQGKYHIALQSLLQTAGYYYLDNSPQSNFAFLNKLNSFTLILNAMQYSLSGVPSRGFVQQGFGEEIHLSIKNDIPLGDFTHQIEFRIPQPNKKITVKTIEVKSNLDGIMKIPLEIPQATGQYSITIRPSHEYLIEPFASSHTSDPALAFIQKMKQIIDTKTLRITFPISSQASSVPIAIFVLDTDIAGSSIDGDGTTMGLAEILQNNNFQDVLNISESPSDFADRASFIQYVKEEHPHIKRVLHGRADIENFTESRGVFSVSVVGNIHAIRISDGKVLLTSTQQLRIDGTTASGTIYNAFNTLGQRMASDFIHGLP